jgi:hypothetical protein
MTYQYQSDGRQYVNGVPARDLTSDEFNALSADLQAACVDSGLYVQQQEA